MTVRHHLAAGVAIILSPYALRDVRAEIMCAPGTRWVPTLDGRVVPDEERPDGYVGDLFGLPAHTQGDALTNEDEVQFVRDCVASVIGDPAHATQVRFYLEGKSMTSWFVGMVMARVGASSRIMSPALVRIIATEVKAALDLLVDASRKETP